MKYFLSLSLFFIVTSLSAQTDTDKYLAKCFIATSVVTDHPQLTEDPCKLILHSKKHEYGYLCGKEMTIIGKWKKVEGNKFQLRNKETKEIIEFTSKIWSDQKIILSGMLQGYKYEVTLTKNN